MKVAFGKINITPPEIAKGEAAKINMAGYSRKHYARGVLDPVMSHGVLIEDIILGNVKKQLLFITIDTLKIPMKVVDYIKERLQDEYRIAPNQVLVHATHTHQAPDLTGEYHWTGNVPAIMRGIMFGLNRNDRYIAWMTFQIAQVIQVAPVVQHIVDHKPIIGVPRQHVPHEVGADEAGSAGDEQVFQGKLQATSVCPGGHTLRAAGFPGPRW